MGISVLILLGIGYLAMRSSINKTVVVTNFDECEKAGYPVMESYPRQCRGQNKEMFVEELSPIRYAEMNTAITLKQGEQAIFKNGLTISVAEINDSRCAPDVVCIWAGEIGITLSVYGLNSENNPQVIRLGTITTPSVSSNGYTFTLKTATTTAATIIVNNIENIMSDQTIVEQYIRDNIKTLAPENPVLGGNWYVTSVTLDEAKKTGSMVYEDGHIQRNATFIYARTGDVVTVSSVKKQIIPVETKKDCFVGGCSNQICSDQKNIISDCMYKAEYACYKTATCERQSTGECDWTETSALKACLGGGVQ